MYKCKYSKIQEADQEITIEDGTRGIASEAFYDYKYIKSVTIPETVRNIGESAFKNCIGLKEIQIGNGVTNIERNVFSGCNSLTDITIPESVKNIGTDAFPQTMRISTSVGKSLLALWNAGYGEIKETNSDRVIPMPELSIIAATASSVTMSSANEYTKYNETVKKEDSLITKRAKGQEIVLRRLEPDKLYEDIYLTLSYEDVSYTKNFSYRTQPLTLITRQPKVISEGNVIVAAQSNLDEEEQDVGFEWRRIDWTEDFDSKTGGAYLYDGMMEGYIRSLNSRYLWKFRPFYTSNSGNTYYGEWKGIDPSDYSYFEPTVHTYATISVQGNMAEVKGYVMRGTDNVTSQGFMYWSAGSSSSRRMANGIPSDAKTILASGNVMTATLENLEYETQYCYVAFVKTSEGETFYGEPQTFKTNADPDPDGIREIESLTPTLSKGEGEWFTLDGRKTDKPQKEINIIRYSDGTSKKVLLK